MKSNTTAKGSAKLSTKSSTKASTKKKSSVRIHKIIADSGLCSRRNAEDLIKAGRVKLNGSYVEIGQSANPKKDKITVDDIPLETQKKRYIIMHKPFNFHTTTKDPFTNKTVIQILEKAGIKERLYPVGRLDKNASGLLLLTNDGDWANSVIHPSIGFEKEYHVKTNRALSKEEISKIAKGIMLSDGPVQAKVKAVSRGFYSISLKAGRHKIVKRIFKYFNIHVTGLSRVRIGPYKLGKLKIGECKEIKPETIKQTKRSKQVIKTKTIPRRKIFGRKENYADRKIEKKYGKKGRDRKKVSPKIDLAYTKKIRERERVGKKGVIAKREKRVDRHTRSKSKQKKWEESKKEGRSKFKRGKKSSNEQTDQKRVRKIGSPNNKQTTKTRSSKPKESRRLHSAKTSKPFDKEKMLKRIGKKRDPLKPKKGAKKRWDKEPKIKSQRDSSRSGSKKPNTRKSSSSKGHKPFDKEKMLKKVGKKKDPLAPKKGAKKRWAKK